MLIVGIYANYGGSTHDSFIWNNSQIKAYLENNLEPGEQAWLIGDSGYPQSKVLMTPYNNPLPGTPEGRYNEAHIRARNIVERTIGLLKVRFRCILKERTSRYSPEYVTKIIKACAVLHNLCVRNNVPLPHEQVQLRPNEVDAPGPNDVPNRHEGMLARQMLVNTYFR